MKSTLPSWEDGAWTNIMPSTSKVVSRLMEFPEPGHRYVPCVISFVPCQAENTHSRFHRLIGDQSVRIRQQVFLGYVPCACHCWALGVQNGKASRIDSGQRPTLPRTYPCCAITEGSMGHQGVEQDYLSQLLGSARCLWRKLLTCVSKGP